MELCNIYNESVIMDILESRSSYAVILENIELMKEASASGQLIVINEESDKIKSKKAIDAYIKDVKAFTSKNKSEADLLRNKSKIWAWISLGSYLIGMIVGLGVVIGGSVLLGQVIICVGALITIVASMISQSNFDKNELEVSKLQPVKKQLNMYKKKISNTEDYDRLDKLINRIDKITDESKIIK